VGGGGEPGVLREREVVEAGDGDVVGDPAAVLGEDLDDAESRLVAARDDGVRAGPAPQDRLGSGAATARVNGAGRIRTGSPASVISSA
jgi:hypothetical protein